MAPIIEETTEAEISCPPSSPELSQPYQNVVKETSVLLQLRSRYRLMKRMHPYADERMKMKEVLIKMISELRKKNQANEKNQEEIMNLKNSVNCYKEQIDWQDERIKSLENEVESKNEEINTLKEKLNKNENLLKKKNEESEKIQKCEKKIALLTEKNDALEKSSDGAIESTKDANNRDRDELMKSQDDRIQVLEKELTDLNYRVKKQEMQIQFLEYDLQYKDKAASTYTENMQRQEIKIQFLEVELNYRKQTEDVLRQNKEKLETKVTELTKSADSLKNENLSLNNILKEMKSVTNRDGCPPSDEFCCETVKQVRLSFIDLIETEFECVICNGMFIEATVTTCNHMFCDYCLRMWRKKSPNCPICRSFIRYEIKTTIIDNFILNAAKMISDRLFTDRKKLLDERKQAKNSLKFKRLCVATLN